MEEVTNSVHFFPCVHLITKLSQKTKIWELDMTLRMQVP